jgi:hypothetical protein
MQLSSETSVSRFETVEKSASREHVAETGPVREWSWLSRDYFRLLA